MGNNKIIKICGIILGIFVIAAIFEVSIKGIVKKVEDFSEQREEEKRQEEIYNSEEAKMERQISEFAKIVCAAVEDKDYNYLWKTMDETYKKYKFNDEVNKLKEYISTQVSYGDAYEVTRVNKTGILYQVTIGVTSGESYTSKYITVNAKEANYLKFMFDEFISLKEMEQLAVYEDLRYEIDYYYKSSAFIAYVINIKNISDKDINIEFLNTSLAFSNATRSKGSKPETIILKPNESKQVEIYFGESNIGVSYIEFEINKNGENVINKINFLEKM